MISSLGETSRRGDFVTHEVMDHTRVGHPKTADVIETKDGLLVVPVNPQNPIAQRDTMDEAMAFIRRYLELER